MKPDEQAEIAHHWWSALQPPKDKGSAGLGPQIWQRGDRAALARLRRVHTLVEAAAEPATIDLLERIGGGYPALEKAALVAAVLAHVRADRPGPVARQLGPKGTGGGAPVLSALRLRRLTSTLLPAEQLIQFRRLVDLARGELNTRDLAAALLDWSDGRRRRWIFDYYTADAPTPPAAPEGAPS